MFTANESFESSTGSHIGAPSNCRITAGFVDTTMRGTSVEIVTEGSGFLPAKASTIMDSNLTNLIAMACLYGFGSGTVKGFAVTVAIGTVVQAGS